jgi:hypothetical protein
VHALAEPSPAPRRRLLLLLLGPVLLSAGCLAASMVATAEFVALARAWL